MDALVFGLIGLMFGLFISASVSQHSAVEEYQKKCKDAGGVPAITAKGPDVCLNPSALIKGVE